MMESPSKLNIALKWGAIMGATLIIISLLFYLTGMVDMETGKSGWLSNVLNYIISIGAIVMAIREFKSLNNNNLSIGNATVIGILTGIVGGIIMAIWTYIFMTMISPDILENIKEQALANSGGGGQEQEEMVGKMMEAIFSPGFMGLMVVIMKFFLGLFVGLVAGLIMKEERASHLFEEE